MSDFSNGISISSFRVTHGKEFYVNNSGVLPKGGIGASNANDGSYLRPFSTIDFAVGKCVANRGDTIYVLPGHVETVATAGGLAVDVAGVKIVGLGKGTKRAKVNMTATASTITVSAVDCELHNLLITGGIDAVVSCIVVSASDVLIKNCEVRDVTGEMVVGILTTAAADRLKILDHVHNGATGAGSTAAIAIVGGTDIEITAVKIDGNFSVGGIDVRTTATVDLFVHDVKSFRTRNAADIFLVDTITASTGQIGPNINIQLQDNAANITEAVTGATFVVQDPIYVVNLAGEKGMLINWVASTDA